MHLGIWDTERTFINRSLVQLDDRLSATCLVGLAIAARVNIDFLLEFS